MPNQKTTTSKKNEHQLQLDGFRQLVSDNSPSRPTIKRSSIVDEIARERKLKNDDAEQDIDLKRKTLNRLFWFLALETVVIFVFAFLQATESLHFRLEEWSFKLLTTVTITQITVMLLVAVNYLFPKKK